MLLKIAPSNILYAYRVEYYFLELTSMQDEEKFQIDLTLLKYCSLKENSNFILGFEIKAEKNINELQLIANTIADAGMFVSGINYISQLLKCKIYALQKELKEK